MLKFCSLILVFYSRTTPLFKLSPFLFASQRNADVLKLKLRLSWGAICRLQGLKAPACSCKSTITHWESTESVQPGADLDLTFNHRHMNISHPSTKRFRDISDVFQILHGESSSLHRSSLSHIKDGLAHTEWVWFQSEEGGWGGSGSAPPRLKSERVT